MRNRIERLRLWLLAGAGLLVLVLGGFIGSARYLRRHGIARMPAKLGRNIKSESNDVTLSHTSKGGTVYKIRAAKEDELTDGKIALHGASILLYGPKQNRSDRIYGDEFEYDQSEGLLRAIGVVHIDMQASATGVPDAKRGEGEPGGKAVSGHGESGGEAKVLHATTSGLVYMEKLDVAATNERVEFQLGAMSGHAVGADYSSDSDVLMLHSAVYVEGIQDGRAVVLTASSAQIDNRNHVTFLTGAKYVSEGQTIESGQATLHTRSDGTLERVEAQGGVTAEERGATVACPRADVMLNDQGKPQSALLSGGVVYALDEPLRQRRAQADSAEITFDGAKDPVAKHAVFTGSVHMTQRTRAAGTGAAAGREPWSVGDLTAARVEVALEAVAGKAQPRDAEATGAPHLTMVSNGSLASPRGEGRSDLLADDLKAHFIASEDAKAGWQIDTLAGRGHTALHQVNAEGVEQSSLGDTLDAKFRAETGGGFPKGAAGLVGGVAGSGASKGRQASDTLLSAVQQGHVSMTRRVPAGSGEHRGAGTNGAGQDAAKPVRASSRRSGGGDDVEDAVAARAVYDGDLDRMTLTGAVRLNENGSVVWANRIALDHATGDALAEGSVKVDYVDDSSGAGAQARPAGGSLRAGNARGTGAPQNGQQRGQQEPTHVLADRAELDHAKEIGTFYGKPARMWQGGSQVQAPVLEFAQEQRRLIAHVDGGAAEKTSGTADGVAEVHTLLVSGGGDRSGATKPTADQSAGSKAGTCRSGPAGAGKSASAKSASGNSTAGGARAGGGSGAGGQVVRIASRELVYSDVLRTAEFTGGVQVRSADGTMLASQATAFLQRPADEDADEGPGAAEGSASVVGNPGTAVNPGGMGLDGRIDHVVASGKVDIEQPGLHATGSGLLYTASDGVYLLTGDGGVLPRVVDAQGTTTAVAFRFTSGDCGVEALNAAPGAKGSGQRVRTDTVVSEERKGGSAKR
jgi:lipopolysaccharide export system protein LptA